MHTSFPQFSVDIEREQINVETMHPARVPDEEWRFVDSNGHGHFWKGKRDLPTLEWIVTGTHWVGDEYGGEEIEDGEYRCRLCAEVVEPGMRYEYGPRFLPGPALVTVTINGESFLLSEDEYVTAVDAWAESLRRIRG